MLLLNLRMLPHATGVQMSAIPEDALNNEDEEEDEDKNPDERISIRASDEDNGWGGILRQWRRGGRDRSSYKPKAKRMKTDGEVKKERHQKNLKEEKETKKETTEAKDENKSASTEKSEEKSEIIEKKAASPAVPEKEKPATTEDQGSRNVIGLSKVKGKVFFIFFYVFFKKSKFCDICFCD